MPAIKTIKYLETHFKFHPQIFSVNIELSTVKIFFLPSFPPLLPAMSAHTLYIKSLIFVPPYFW